MGSFFSTVQIKNTGSREQFISSFCDLMKKRNLVQCTDDEAEVQYILAFSEGGWVTLASDVYKSASKQAHDDAQQTAKEMNTSSFSMEVVDSDWAIIGLHTGADIHDTVIVGRSAFPEEQSPKGRQECWEQLLAQGKTWEQLSEIWNKNEVFVEDAMQEAASVLGIEPKYMISEYDDFNSEADTNSDILPLFFKKNITVSKNGEKKLTLNAAFKQVFGEALEPLGFVKAKTKYPYYVRVIGDEIVQVVAVKEEFGSTFDIVSGIATVYRAKIDLSQSVKFNTNWLMTIANYYSCVKFYDTDYDDYYRRKIMFFNFRFTNNDDKINIFNYALEQFKKWVLPMLNKIDSIQKVYEYFSKYFSSELHIETPDNFKRINSENESLTLFNFNDPYAEMDKRFKKSMEQIDFVFKHNKEGYGEEYFEARRKNSMLLEKSQKETLNKIISSEENYQKILDERERRKKANIERLRSYGVII